jgi:Flp pilus assembly protein TadG
MRGTSQLRAKNIIVDRAPALARRLRLELSDDRGQALVEFALVLPLVLVLIMGILWFGRAFNYSIDQTHLANEAARYAAVNSNPSSSPNLNAWILSQIDTSELKSGSSGPGSGVNAPGAALTICYPNVTSNVGDPVKVTVRSTFHFIPILNLGDAPITGSATMRIEVPPSNNVYVASATC